jgi:preprotein translocase subunit SecG
MDEKVAKYLRSYGILAAFVALVVFLGEFRFVALLRGFLVLVSFVLIGAVLIQQGKGGGLVGALGGMSGDTMFGTTATPVKKFTAAVAIIFIVGVLVLGRAEREAVKTRAAAAGQLPAPTQEAPVEAPVAPMPMPQAPAPGPK